MKKLFLFTTLLFTAACTSPFNATITDIFNAGARLGGFSHDIFKDDASSCRVYSIHDGDTFTCIGNDKRTFRVRLVQIDSPEIEQPFGIEAKQKLTSLISNQIVQLKGNNQNDQYNRVLAEVFINDTNINKLLVADGYAWAYHHYITDSEYITLEEKAKAAHLGLWALDSPISPYEWRRGVRNNAQNKIITAPAVEKIQSNRDSINSQGVEQKEHARKCAVAPKHATF